MPSQNETSKASDTQLIVDFWRLPEDALVDQRVVAAVLGYSQAWCERSRWSGLGPRFVRLGGVQTTNRRGETKFYGGRVRYRVSDIRAFIAERPCVRSTSQYQITEPRAA